MSPSNENKNQQIMNGNANTNTTTNSSDKDSYNVKFAAVALSSSIPLAKEAPPPPEASAVAATKLKSANERTTYMASESDNDIPPFAAAAAVAGASSPPAYAATSFAAASSSVAASMMDADATLAQALHAVESLTQLFGFSQQAANEAVNVVGVNITECYNYILDQGLGMDQGGAIHPIDPCCHVLSLQQCYNQQQHHHPVKALLDSGKNVFEMPCMYHQLQQQKLQDATSISTARTKPKIGRLKSEYANDPPFLSNSTSALTSASASLISSPCPMGENWLCLTCGATLCSRYVNGHGIQHWEDYSHNTTSMDQSNSTSTTHSSSISSSSSSSAVAAASAVDPHQQHHCVAVSLADLSTWCHECQAYINSNTPDDTFLRPILEQLETMKFPNDRSVENDIMDEFSAQLRADSPASLDPLPEILKALKLPPTEVQLYDNNYDDADDDDDMISSSAFEPTRIENMKAAPITKFAALKPPPPVLVETVTIKEPPPESATTERRGRSSIRRASWCSQHEQSSKRSRSNESHYTSDGDENFDDHDDKNRKNDSNDNHGGNHRKSNGINKNAARSRSAAKNDTSTATITFTSAAAAAASRASSTTTMPPPIPPPIPPSPHPVSSTSSSVPSSPRPHGFPVSFDSSSDDNSEDTMRYPFGDLPTSLEDVAKFILSSKCKSIIVLSGAGMSVRSGIPDFRSANGLYATLDPNILTASDEEKDAIAEDPATALNHDLFVRNPLPCLELNRNFLLGTQQKKWKATLAHRFVELLHTKFAKKSQKDETTKERGEEDRNTSTIETESETETSENFKGDFHQYRESNGYGRNKHGRSSNYFLDDGRGCGGKLVRLYTQNIDGLEDQCKKLPRSKVITVHGSMDRAECLLCKSESNFNQFCEKVRRQIKDITLTDPTAPLESTPIECQACGRNTMKPAIVLFKSNLPRRFFELTPKDVQNVDLLIVIGTSLQVAPANMLVRRVPKTALRVVINRDPVGIQLGIQYGSASERDFFCPGDIDTTILELLTHLGWLEDLEPLLEQDLLPKSSAELLRQRLERERRTSVDR